MNMGISRATAMSLNLPFMDNTIGRSSIYPPLAGVISPSHKPKKLFVDKSLGKRKGELLSSFLQHFLLCNKQTSKRERKELHNVEVKSNSYIVFKPFSSCCREILLYTVIRLYTHQQKKTETEQKHNASLSS